MCRITTLTETLGRSPLGRFITTYNSDYKPPSERHPQVNQVNPRTEAKAAPVLINPTQYFYMTANSISGLGGCSQPPSCSLFPAFLPPVSEAAGVAGSTLTGATTHEVGVAGETGFGEEEEKTAIVLEQQDAKDEPQEKMDVLYEEGVIVLSSHVDLACCEDFLRTACREVGQLHLPMTSSLVIPDKDAESWDNSVYPRGLGPAILLKNNTSLQPPCRQHSCCAQETECPNSCHLKTPAFPRGSTQSLACVQPTVCRTEPSRKPWLTEYQASYTAAWAQPKIQQSDLHHCPLPHHFVLRSNPQPLFQYIAN
uniref:uncharacterized protein LOC124054950 isoform X2 n=1 Tax=Scatophagus argus TaxID=75038 RepID=UPI001ED8384A|nr:uncharacterized protein LOC124054950 isoform X2 [Scatophagus argus]